MDGGGAGGGVKTNGGNNNNYEFNLLLQQLKTSFMNGQITAQQYELAQQQLTTQYATTNAAPSAPAMGHVQRRATLTPAELNKIKKQGGAGGTKCKWCFCGILIIVGVPLLLWFLFLGFNSGFCAVNCFFRNCFDTTTFPAIRTRSSKWNDSFKNITDYS